MPLMNEQYAIVVHIALEAVNVVSVRAVIERTIGLTKERRAAFYTICQLELGELDTEESAA
jgi:hypothetical protein